MSHLHKNKRTKQIWRVKYQQQEEPQKLVDPCYYCKSNESMYKKSLVKSIHYRRDKMYIIRHEISICDANETCFEKYLKEAKGDGEWILHEKSLFNNNKQ